MAWSKEDIVETATHPDSRRAFVLTTNYRSATPHQMAQPSARLFSLDKLSESLASMPFDNAAFQTLLSPRMRPHAGHAPATSFPRVIQLRTQILSQTFPIRVWPENGSESRSASDFGHLAKKLHPADPSASFIQFFTHHPPLRYHEPPSYHLPPRGRDDELQKVKRREHGWPTLHLSRQLMIHPGEEIAQTRWRVQRRWRCRFEDQRSWPLSSL